MLQGRSWDPPGRSSGSAAQHARKPPHSACKPEPLFVRTGPAGQATASRPGDSPKGEDKDKDKGFRNEELPEGGSDSGSDSAGEDDDGF